MAGLASVEMWALLRS